MIIKTAEFKISNTDYKKCPPPHLHEYAFIGRSNVGKSSLINMLTNRKKLAKTSSSPGKTRLINHFIINNNWYLVDLPGYGYAKVSKKERESWTKLINNYLTKRENLICTFVLIDSRIPPQKKDLEFLEWLGINNISFSIVFTKVDKLTKTKLKSNIESFKNEFLKTWEIMPEFFLTSATSGAGKEELLSYINELNTQIDLTAL